MIAVPETHDQTTPNEGRTKGGSEVIPTPRGGQSIKAGIPQRHDNVRRKEKPPPPTHHPDPRAGGRFMGRDRRLPGHFRPFTTDERRGRRAEVYTVDEKPTSKGSKMCYYEYHKSRKHDMISCSVLKREIEEKQLKGNVIEIAKSLRAMFDAKNPKDATGRENRRLEILAIHHKRGRAEHTVDT